MSATFLNPLPNIINVMKYGRLEGNVACMLVKRMAYNILNRILYGLSPSASHTDRAGAATIFFKVAPSLYSRG
jgi:hypothetical protein